MENKRLFVPRLLWGALLTTLTLLFFFHSLRVDDSMIRYYYKAKESRRGKIRKAREKKDSLSFQEEREGVLRQLFLHDPSGQRREFSLEAKEAKIDFSLRGKKRKVKETFFQPKGWLQEKLFWEISSTHERVMKKGVEWAFEADPEKRVPEALIANIIPMQEVRYFDATKAEWDIDKNILVAHDSSFCILKRQGHELVESLDNCAIMAKGVADTLTFSFNKEGKEEVSCSAMRMEFPEGSSL